MAEGTESDKTHIVLLYRNVGQKKRSKGGPRMHFGPFLRIGPASESDAILAARHLAKAFQLGGATVTLQANRMAFDIVHPNVQNYSQIRVGRYDPDWKSTHGKKKEVE